MSDINYCVEMQMNIEISFEDKEKSEEYFIHGDWKNYFYEYDNLEEIAGHIAYAFNVCPTHWSKERKTDFKFIEGFGEFFREDNTKWINFSDETGNIMVEIIQDLEVEYIDEA